MKITMSEGVCHVEREKGDPKFRSTGWGNGESRLLHHVKKILNQQGYDLIKKRMWKDGHLVDEQQQYLRTRKTNGKVIAIYNTSWAVAGAERDFNEYGHVDLSVTSLKD